MAGDEHDALTNDDVEVAGGPTGSGMAESSGTGEPLRPEGKQAVGGPEPGAGDATDATAEGAEDADDRTFDDLAAAMVEAIEQESVGGAGLNEGGQMEIPELDVAALAGSQASGQSIDLLRDVELNVKIELGRSQMTVEEVLCLGEGAVVELDKLAGDPVDVFVNDRLIARGEVLVLNDNFCVRINEIVEQVDHQEPM